MLIELKKPLLMKLIDTGAFVNVPAGTFGNYSSKREGGSTIHKMSVGTKKGIAESTVVAPTHEVPDWL